MSLITTFFVSLFLSNVVPLVHSYIPFNTAELLGNRPPIQNFPDHHPEEGLLEILLNPTIVANDRAATLGNVLDLEFKAEDVNYELYTKDNKEQSVSLRVGDATLLKDSPFNPAWPTKIIIHGWTESGNAFWVHDIRRNYLSVGDYNVICVDWFAGSTKEYLTAVKLTHQVGEYVAAFIEFLGSETEVSVDDMHILGHSLGAHVAGYIGNYIMPKKLGRITGLDPAGPAFETPYLKDTEERLDAADANFVDIIHTCAGSLGFLRPIGNADFYPNGGTFRQPGCPVFSSQSCSHGRAYQFFAESIVHPDGFVAVQCSNWMDFQLGTCGNNNSNTAVMGEFINPDTEGIFYLQTNAQPPFGKGKIK